MKIIKKIGSFFSALYPIFIYLVVTVAVILASTAIVALYNLSTNSMDSEFPTGSLLSDTAMIAVNAAINIASVIAVFVEMKLRGYKVRDISPVKQNHKMYLLAAAFALAAYFVMRFLNLMFLQITGIPSTEVTEQLTGAALANTVTNMLMLPFVDELIYRGLTVKTFENKFPVWFSAAAITLIYGVLCSNENRLYTLLLGSVLIFIRYKFGDIKLCLLCHFIINLTYCLTRFADKSVYVTLINIGSAVGIVIAAVTMFLMLKFASKPADNNDNI